MIQVTGILGQVDPLHNVPDHALLAWSFLLDCKLNTSEKAQLIAERIKYNVNSIAAGFMLDDETKRCLFETVQNLESSLREQDDIDKAYNDFSSVVKQSMNANLQKKSIKISSGVSKRKDEHKNLGGTMFCPTCGMICAGLRERGYEKKM